MPDTTKIDFEQISKAAERAAKNEQKQRAEAEKIAGAGNAAGIADCMSFIGSMADGKSVVLPEIPIPIIGPILDWVVAELVGRSAAWLKLDYQDYRAHKAAWDSLLVDVPETRQGLCCKIDLVKRLGDDPWGVRTNRFIRRTIGFENLKLIDVGGREIDEDHGVSAGATYFVRAYWTAAEGFDLGKKWGELAANVQVLKAYGVVTGPLLVFDSYGLSAEIPAVGAGAGDEPDAPTGLNPLVLVGIGASLITQSPAPLILLVPALFKPKTQITQG